MSNIVALTGKVGADTSGFEAGMDRVKTKAERAARGVHDAFAREMRATRQTVEQQTQLMGKALGGIKGLGAAGLALVGAESIRSVVMLADKYNGLEQRLRTATKLTGDFAAVNQQLFSVAQRNGAAFEDTVSTFQALARSSKELGATNSDMIKLTDTVQKLGVIGGSSSEAMKNGLLQFSQAMAGGVVHAEEFNSILENMPEVANRIAAGMGMSVGHLRQLVASGKVASKDVFDSLLKQSEAINKEFEKMPLSVDRSAQAAQNSFAKLMSSIDKTIGGTQALAASMKGVADSTDRISANIAKWNEKQLSFKGTTVTNKNLLDATFSALGKTLTQTNYANSPGLAAQIEEDLKAAAARDAVERNKAKFGKKPAEVAAVATESKEAEKAREKAEKDAERAAKKAQDSYADAIASLQIQNREIEMQIAHKTRQFAIDKEIANLADKMGRSLTDVEKANVENLMIEHQRLETQKERIELAKKERELAIEAANAHAKELGRSIGGLYAQADGTSDVFQRQQQRKDFALQLDKEKQDPATRERLLKRFDEETAAQHEASTAGVMRGLNETAASLQAKISHTERQYELEKLLNEEAKKYGDSQAEQAQLIEAKKKISEAFWRNEKLYGQEFLAQQKRSNEGDAEAISYQKLLNEGKIEEAEYSKLVFEWNERELGVLDEKTKLQLREIAHQKMLNRDEQEALRIKESLKTEQQRYNDKVAELTRLFNEGKISGAEWAKALNQANPQLAKLRDTAKEVASAFESAFDKMLFKSGKLSDAFKQLGQDLLKIAERRLIFEPLEKGLNSLIDRVLGAKTPNQNQNQNQTQNQTNPLGGLVSSGFNWVKKLLGFASGGRPPMDRFSVVGENGPELFMPDSAGTIFSNEMFQSLGGGDEIALSMFGFGGNSLFSGLRGGVSSNAGSEGWTTLGSENAKWAEYYRNQAAWKRSQGLAMAAVFDDELARKFTDSSFWPHGAFNNPIAPYVSQHGNAIRGGFASPDNLAEAFGVNDQASAIRGQAWSQTLSAAPERSFVPGSTGALRGIANRSIYDQFNVGHGLYGHQMPSDTPGRADPNVHGGVFSGLPYWSYDDIARDFVGSRGPARFARGGRPAIHRPSIVGESGPELFVPDTAGAIIPNNALRGGGGAGGAAMIEMHNHLSDLGIDISHSETQGSDGTRKQRFDVGEDFSRDLATNGPISQMLQRHFVMQRRGVGR